MDYFPPINLTPIPLPRVPVQSSHLVSVGYQSDADPNLCFLEVEFRSGAVYRYFCVPRATYEALISAPSIGQFFDQVVKKRFAYQRL